MTAITRPVTGVVNESTGRTVSLVPAFIAPEGMSMESFGEHFDAAMKHLFALGIDPARIICGELNEDPVALVEAHDNGRRTERAEIADELMEWAERHQERERYGVSAALAIASNKVRKGFQP